MTDKWTMPQSAVGAFEQIGNRLATVERILLRISDQQEQLLEHVRTAGPQAPVGMAASQLPMASDAPDPEWIPVRHVVRNPKTEYTQGCGYPALYLIRPFFDNERADIHAMRVRRPGEINWHEPVPGQPSLCSNCGQPIDPWSDRDLNYRSVLYPAPAGPIRTTRLTQRDRGRSAPADTGTPVTGRESVVVAAPHSGGALPESPAPIFPGHTPQAEAEARLSLAHAQSLARMLHPEEP